MVRVGAEGQARGLYPGIAEAPSLVGRIGLVGQGSPVDLIKGRHLAFGIAHSRLPHLDGGPTGGAFQAGARTGRLVMQPIPDPEVEGDEIIELLLNSFNASASGGSMVAAGGQRRVTGTLINEDRQGTSRADTLIGTDLNDLLDGRAGADTLTGRSGFDQFAFRYGESTITNPDWITDFTFARDFIRVYPDNPSTFSRSPNNSNAADLPSLAASVFADADGCQSGNQALGARAAALVVASHPAIAGTYLVVNNQVRTQSNTDDLLIKLNGYTGALPGFGAIPDSANQVFG